MLNAPATFRCWKVSGVSSALPQWKDRCLTLSCYTTWHARISNHFNLVFLVTFSFLPQLMTCGTIADFSDLSEGYITRSRGVTDINPVKIHSKITLELSITILQSFTATCNICLTGICRHHHCCYLVKSYNYLSNRVSREHFQARNAWCFSVPGSLKYKLLTLVYNRNVFLMSNNELFHFLVVLLW